MPLPHGTVPPAAQRALPDEFMRAVRAFQESRTLLTAIELDLFTAVGRGAVVAEVAERIHADTRGTGLLLHALAALGLLEKRQERFFNGPLAAEHLCADSAHDARAALMHQSGLWNRWSHLTECVRRGAPAPRDAGSAETEAFIAAMHHNASTRAPELIRALGPDPVGRVLDLGGGSGAYSIALARAFPGCRAEVFDLDEVIPIAARNIASAGLSDRVAVRAGDLHTSDLGSGYTLVLISAVCHMNSPQQNRDLVARAVAALDRGGRLAIHDFILEPSRTAPAAAALFSLNMLVSTAAGMNYTEEEYLDWLRAAGLSGARVLPLPGPTTLILASKP
jgi:precorrin-6B methylase 2